MGSRGTVTAAGPDPLPSQLLHYNSTYRVLFCTECKYAIQPTGIVRHLKEIHHIRRSRRRPFTQYASKFDLASPEEVFQTSIYEFPVPGLPIWEGLRCEEKGCGHLCISEKRMRSHWMSEHVHQGRGKDVDWKEARLQTFFRGNLLRYFTEQEEEKVGAVKERWLPRCVLYDTLGHARQATEQSIMDAVTQDIAHLIDDLELEPQNSLDEKDSFLLQHYIDHTASSIATDPATLKLWQESVPYLARSEKFLLHGILALSALHLAHVTPSDSPLHSQYLLSATTHQDAAMPVFRSAIAAVTPDTCHAVFVFSHILVLYCFASESQDERLFIVAPTPDLSPVWLQFLRAGCRLLCHVWDDLEEGPVRALASTWEIPELELNEGRTLFVKQLMSFIPARESQDAWSEEEDKIYTETAILLGRAFSNVVLGTTFTTWDALRMWPTCISIEYLEMLRKQHPGALVLLAHYCVLLKRIEGNWYFEGRATGLLRSVVGCLDRKWMEAVRWPMNEIGMEYTCSS